MLAKLIPPYKINYNHGGSRGDYVKSFSLDFQRYFLPQSILFSRNPDIECGASLPRVLDLGCGFAQMAHALAIAQQACKPLRLSNSAPEDLIYLGIDIREDAINWLEQAYKELPHFKFHHHQAAQAADYVGSFTKDRQASSQTFAHSDGSECKYNIGDKFQADIQWSSSFFTHLTYNAALESLRFISTHLKSDGIAVNTWLIADSGSCLAMETGEADRKCNIDHGAYLTYSQDNPLVCTTYKLNAVKELYGKAGLTIKHILRGSWRGGNIKNEFNHYQDVVIAWKGN